MTRRSPRWSWRAGAGGPGGLGVLLLVLAMLGMAHLVGGASDPISTALLTAGLCLALLVLSLSERRPYCAAYLRSLVWLIVPFALLIGMVAFSCTPGSNVLADNPVSAIVGARTLAIDASAARLELHKLVGLAVMVLIAERLATSARRMRQVLRGLVWVGVVWTGWSLILLAIDSGSTGVGRLSGAFVSPNVAGALIVVTLLVLIGDTIPRPVSGPPRPVFSVQRLSPVLMGLVLVVGLVLSASRACAVIGLSLAGVLWLWPRRKALFSRAREGGAFPVVGGLVAAACGAVALLAGVTLLSRLAHTTLDASDRWAIATIYADAASDAPWTGYGLGSASALSRLLITSDNYPVFWNIHAVHNLVIQWWVEGGVVGLGLAAALVAILVVRIHRGLGPEGRRALGGPITALAFLTLHGMVDYELQIYSIALLAALLTGICLAGAGHSTQYWLRFSKTSRAKPSERSNPASPKTRPAARLARR